MKLKMKDKDKKELLQGLSDKEAEAIINTAEAVSSGIEKMDDKHKEFWKGYQTGMKDAKEVVEEFGRPTEDVLG